MEVFTYTTPLSSHELICALGGSCLSQDIMYTFQKADNTITGTWFPNQKNTYRPLLKQVDVVDYSSEVKNTYYNSLVYYFSLSGINSICCVNRIYLKKEGSVIYLDDSRCKREKN